MSNTIINFEFKSKEDFVKKYAEYQKEIERLKDDNKYLNKVNIELSSEKNRLNNIIIELRKKNINLIEDNMRLRKEINLHGGKLYISDIEVKNVF